MRPRALGFVAIGALVTGSGSLAACSLLTSYDDFTGAGAEDATAPPDSGPAHDAGADARVDGYQPTTEQTLCSPNIPAQPKVSQPPTSGAPSTYTGVVSTLRFVQADGGCLLGKDLDGLDTCNEPGDAGRAACNAAYSMGQSNCDQEGGIDIAGQNLLFEPENLHLAKIDLAGELAGDVTAQRTGFVLTVTDYGGELNNPKVTVTYANDVGIADGGGTLLENQSVKEGFALQDPAAYVSNGVLVAHFKSLPMHFTFLFTNDPLQTPHSLVTTLTDAVIVGVPVLDADAGSLTIDDGQVVGRFTSDDIMTLLTNIFACPGYSAADIICGALDLTAMPANDGLAYGCDAISMGFGFDLVPTTIAGYVNQVPAVDYCATYDAAAPFSGNLCGTSLDAGADDD